MVKKVPSLTAAGWLSEIAERADALLAYYITSEHSQSYLYKGQITSLPYHIRRYGNEPVKLEQRVSSDLHKYLSRYFDKVEVEARTDIPDVDDPNRINLQLDCVIYSGEYRYSLGREIKVANNKVINVFKINNAS